MTQIDDPDLSLSDLFDRAPGAARPFLRLGMLCPGCPIAPFHTIRDACNEYGLDEARFRRVVSRAALMPRC